MSDNTYPPGWSWIDAPFNSVRTSANDQRILGWEFGLPSAASVSYPTKDSGERAEFDSGMVRDTEKGKPRFDLLLAEGIPYSEQFITRFAALMTRGAEKYDPRNWEKAEGEAELARYKSSALRHLIQWLTDEGDEDHAAAVAFNLMAGETVKTKMRRAE